MKEKDTAGKMKKEELNPEEEILQEKLDESGEKLTEEQVETSAEEETEKDEMTILQEKHDEINDRYLRLYSEFDNFRKRTQKEKIDLYKTAGEDVISSMLPVVDDFERALKAIDDNPELKAFKEGILLIYQKLLNTLSQKGLKACESSIGKDFDVNVHEAISQVPTEDKKLKGKVIDEVEKGYMLNEKVIRYSKVVIGA